MKQQFSLNNILQKKSNFAMSNKKMPVERNPLYKRFEVCYHKLIEIINHPVVDDPKDMKYTLILQQVVVSFYIVQ